MLASSPMLCIPHCQIENNLLKYFMLSFSWSIVIQKLYTSRETTGSDPTLVVIYHIDHTCYYTFFVQDSCNYNPLPYIAMHFRNIFVG